MKGSRGLWLIVPWALFGLIALGWVGYWNFVASTAENRINSWVAAQNNAGAQASYLRIVRHGFPVLLRLEIQNISYGPARGGWRATTLGVSSKMYDYQTLVMLAQILALIGVKAAAQMPLAENAAVASDVPNTTWLAPSNPGWL